MAEALIQTKNLSRSFGQAQAVRGVSLQVSAGEIYGLVGPDGAGKTTTLRLLCGALRPTFTKKAERPEIILAGYDLQRDTEQARAQIGYLPQRFSMYEDLSVMENLRFFAELRGLSASDWRPRCMEILQFVGLAEFTQRRAGQLSGGMKQKLGLAAALVHSPRVLLLDEPTTGVDPVTRQDFWQLIISLVAEQGVAVLVSTPYMDEAARCTRVGFLQQGRLLVEGTPAALRERLVERIIEVRGVPLPSLRALVESDPDVEDAQMFGDRLHLRVRSGAASEVIHRISRQTLPPHIQISLVRPVQAQLEDVFIALLEEKT